ncbi:hypothetical protein ACKI2N_006955 [Cupriavidus sp. 30B13]|uniref:hypothetical protein n=1 Tax=Cupriavidus sp. 30B13 TaxID=3384241 RepID=UPI003B91DC67
MAPTPESGWLARASDPTGLINAGMCRENRLAENKSARHQLMRVPKWQSATSAPSWTAMCPIRATCFPKPSRKHWPEGRRRGQQPAGTYARNVLGPLLIDLSWSSSRLEGNRYSLLATEELIRKYAVVQIEAMGVPDPTRPDPMRLRFREALNETIGHIVRDGRTGAEAVALLGLSEQDAQVFQPILRHAVLTSSAPARPAATRYTRRCRAVPGA